jgi:probable rRNA maturation factor
LKVAVNNNCGCKLDVKALKKACLSVMRVEGVRKDAVLSLSAVDEEEMGELNRRYLRGDGPTDVIAFCMGEDCEQGYLMGDVLICPQVILENMRQYDVDEKRVLEYVAAHGVLHILGYEDEEEKDWEEMDRKQREILGLTGGRR